MSPAAPWPEADDSAMRIFNQELGLLFGADRRRVPEFTPTWERLKREGCCIAIILPAIVDGSRGAFLVPTIRLQRLYASLLLRHRLDLPTMDAPDV